jgi:hypothetical protein
MTSQINYSAVNTLYPVPGRDNDSQGFRTNFSAIKDGLEVAFNEISSLQMLKADISLDTPATATSTGVAGQLAIDSVYLYVCIATNTWKRIALGAWT